MMIKEKIKPFVPPVLWQFASKLRAGHAGNGSATAKGEQDAQWYDNYYAQFSTRQEHYAASPYYFMYAVIADRLLRSSANAVLEIGCGRGRLAAILAHRDFTDYLGFDFSEEQLRVARALCPNQQFVHADAFSTDLYSSADYDAVVCTEFLEHVEDDLDVIRRVRKGVRFYGSVPSFDFVSHVRHFRDVNEVTARYGELFHSFRVDPFLFKSEAQTLFIFEGITA